MAIITVSPTRTYVAMCYFKKHYFRKFVLPEDYVNNSAIAAWFFLNKVDIFSALEGVVTFEDYSNIIEVTPMR